MKSDYERCIFWNIHICLRSSSTCTYILTWWSFSEILLMMLAQRLIKQDRNLALWMHSEVNYPQVSSMYNIIHVNLLTIKSCSVTWQLNFHSNALFFAVLFELNRITTSQAKQFLNICRDKFMKSQIEPGTHSLIKYKVYLHHLHVHVYQCRFIYHLYYLFNDVK